MKGRVEQYLSEKIGRDGAIQLTLIDPEKVDEEGAQALAQGAEKAGSAGIMVGGSTACSVYELDVVVKAIKGAVKVPVILFPNDVTGLSQHADAVFFMSLINSSNPYYITGAQALGARLVKKFGLEPIPLAYLIVGDDSGAAGFIGQARPIPFDKPELAAMHALAAQYMGMRFIYLEAGSGARKPIPADFISIVRKAVEVPIIVGGGIRTQGDVEGAVGAGANIVVTGTIGEEAFEVMRGLIESLKVSRSKR